MNAKCTVNTFIILIMALVGCSTGEAGWTTVALPDAGEHTAVAVDFRDGERGMLVTSFRGSSRIYVTRDEGASWALVHEVDFGVHDIVMTEDEKAIAVGNRGILRTADFGASWRVWNADFQEPLKAVDFNGEESGMAVGRNGMILYTEDGGESWSRQESGSASFLTDVMFRGDGVAYAVGSGGTVLYTDDFGEHWTVKSTVVNEDLKAVHFLDGDSGLAIGSNGLILRTSDGGSTWKRTAGNTSNSLLGMHFLGQTGLLVGFDGTVLQTDDGGTSWKQVPIGTNRGLYDVHITSGESAVLVGDQATVMIRK
ncbi:MAG: YCF48-related protein [Balneolaceae bacterium]|nr:YCF48-related protein [Balneolaceae bacterium]